MSELVSLQKLNEVTTERRFRQFVEEWYDEWVDLLRQEQNWMVVSGQGLARTSGDALDENMQRREDYVRRSRLFARREPLSKQAVRLYTTYSGILKVGFKSENEKAEEAWKDNLWDLPDNKRILGSLYRRKLSLRLLTDGELFFALVVGDGGNVIVRTIDSLQMTKLLTHPEDDEIVLYYRREIPAKGDMTDGVVRKARIKYYRDWEVTDESLADAERFGFELPDDGDLAVDSNDNPILVFHAPFDQIGQRGNGLLFAVLSYINTYRNFLQDRATIVRGLATYIRTVTVKGGSKAVGDIAARFQSAFASGGFIDNNPPDATGSTWVQNQQTDKKDEAPITNAGEALSDARVFRQPIASGVGITEATLTGDPSVGNLASQTTMVGTELQNFSDYQQLWEEIFLALWRFVLRTVSIDDTVHLDVSLPPIIREPLNVLSQVLIAGLDKGLVPFDEASRQLLVAMGVDQVDRLVKQAADEKEEREEEAKKQFEQQGPPENGKEPAEETKVAEDEECPFCLGKGLSESHGIRFCQSCEMTYNPDFFETSDPARVARHVEVLRGILDRPELTEEDWEDIAEEMAGGNGRH